MIQLKYQLKKILARGNEDCLGGSIFILTKHLYNYSVIQAIGDRMKERIEIFHSRVISKEKSWMEMELQELKRAEKERSKYYGIIAIYSDNILDKGIIQPNPFKGIYKDGHNLYVNKHKNESFLNDSL